MKEDTMNVRGIAEWVSRIYEWWPIAVEIEDGVGYALCGIDLSVIRVSQDKQGKYVNACDLCDAPSTSHPRGYDPVYRCDVHPWTAIDDHMHYDHLTRPHDTCPACKLTVGDIAYAQLVWDGPWVSVVITEMHCSMNEDNHFILDPMKVIKVDTPRDWHYVSPGVVVPEVPVSRKTYHPFEVGCV
jgi:hypothetical protein